MPQDPSHLSFKQRATYFSSNLALRGILGLAGLVPYRWRIPLIGKLVSALGPVVGFDRRVRENLALTCPELDEPEVARLCREVGDNAGRMITELYAGAPFITRATAAPIAFGSVVAVAFHGLFSAVMTSMSAFEMSIPYAQTSSSMLFS